CLGGDAATHFAKQLRLELNDSLVSAEHFLFPLAQLGRREPFGIRERLAPFILNRNAHGVRFGNLDDVTKHAVETDAQVTDAPACAFGGFEGGDDLFRVATDRTQLVELDGIPGANRVAISELYR